MNIYINKENEEILKQEDSMSGLINKLLKEHWERVGKKVADFNTVGIRSEIKSEAKDDNTMVTTVTPHPGDVERFRSKVSGSRTKGVIMTEIKKQEAYVKDLENQTQVNQDPDLQELIVEERAIYQGLWDEYNQYNQLKGE